MGVPRGTTVMPVAIGGALRTAIVQGLKTQTRRPVTVSNTVVPRGRPFEQFDFSSAHAADLRGTQNEPAVLVGRQEIPRTDGETERRTISLKSRVHPNTVLWPNGKDYGRDHAPSLWVRKVTASRLHSITEDDAIREGVWVFAIGSDTSSDRNVCAYAAMLEQMGPHRKRKWLERPEAAEHLSSPSARACFALLWEMTYGNGSWGKNPWVWCYEFVRCPFAAAAAADFLRRGLLHKMLSFQP